MFPDREGQRVPQATFRTRTESGEWKAPSSDDVFKGKTVVVGAITGRGTVPQVFINGRHIGGLEDLQQWARKAA